MDLASPYLEQWPPIDGVMLKCPIHQLIPFPEHHIHTESAPDDPVERQQIGRRSLAILELLDMIQDLYAKKINPWEDLTQKKKKVKFGSETVHSNTQWKTDIECFMAGDEKWKHMINTEEALGSTYERMSSEILRISYSMEKLNDTTTPRCVPRASP